MRIQALVGLTALALTTAPIAHAADEHIVGDPSHAVFDGRTIDLGASWEGARACIELGLETRCYASIRELLGKHSQELAPQQHQEAGGVSLLGTCGSSLALWDAVNQVPPVLYLTTTGVFHNLSSFGFDNRTSSYMIGACSADFFADPHGGGSLYPGDTSAGASFNSMVVGWNNRVSSVYIH